MGLLFMDGFDSGLQKASVITIGGGIPYYAPNLGINGTGALAIPCPNSSDSGTCTFSWPDPLVAVSDRYLGISFWFKSVGYPWGSFEPVADNIRFIARDNYYGYIRFHGSNYSAYTNYIRIADFDSSSHLTTDIAIGTNPFDNQWHHFKLWYKASNTGTIKVWFDNKLVYNNTNIDTYWAGSYFPNSLRLGMGYNGSGSRNPGMLYDDLIVWDSNDSGDGFYTDENLPSQVIYTLRPTADTAQKNSVPSTGSDSFAMIDESGPANTVTDYITLAPGGQDVYDLGEFPVNTNVRALTVTSKMATNSLAGFANTKVFLKANGIFANSNTYSFTSLSFLTTNGDLAANYSPLLISCRDFGNVGSPYWAQTSISGLQIGIENVGI